jgi:hypothetical protein
VGVAVEAGRRRLDVTTRDSADATEVLTQDELGITTLQRVVVECVKIQAGLHPSANEIVDLVWRHGGISEGPHDDLSILLNAIGPVALCGHTEQLLLES